MAAGHLANLLPRTTLTQLAWLVEFGYIFVGIGVFWRFLQRDAQEHGTGDSLPDADAIRNQGPGTLAHYETRPILHQLLRTLYSRRGYIQEEEVVATVEEKVLSRGDSLRDWAALAILTALLFTFLTLYLELRGSTASMDFNTRLTAIFDLVGVNWPGILAGLICTVLAAVVRYKNIRLLNQYRSWLDVDIFPNLSVARTTVDQLGSLAGELRGAVEKLSIGLQPLAQLPAVLSRFQNDVIGGLVPKLVEGIQRVPVSFSDATVQQLRKMSGDSTRLIAQVTRDYGRLVLMSEQSTERQTEIAAGVKEAVSALKELKPTLSEVVSVFGDYNKATESISLALANVEIEMRELRNEIPNVVTAASIIATDVKSLAEPIDQATQALNEIRPDLQGMTKNVAAFTSTGQEIAIQATELGRSIFEILPEIRAFSTVLTNSTATVSTDLTSLEATLTGSISDMRAIVDTVLTEARLLDGTLTLAHQAVSNAQQSLTDSTRDLFARVAKAQEDQRKAVTDAGVALQNATGVIEKTITNVAERLAAGLREAGELAKEQRELEKDLFESAIKAHEAQNKTVTDASVALQNTREIIEKTIIDAAEALATKLREVGELAKKQRELEGAMTSIKKDIADVDRNTRGRALLRRVFNAEGPR